MRATGCVTAIVLAIVPPLVLLVAAAACQLRARSVFYGPAAVDFSFSLSGDYELFRTSAHQVTVHPTGCYDPTEWPTIPAKVESIAWDRRHILAMQRPPKYFGEEKVPPDEFRFWILDVQARKLNGPLTRTQFDAHWQALGVADRLHLKPVRRPRTLFGG